MTVLHWLCKEPGLDRPGRSVLLPSPNRAPIRDDLAADSAGSS